MTKPALFTSQQAKRESATGPRLARLLGHPAVLCSILALITIVVFWPTVRAEFLQFDDPDYVTSNPQVLNGLSPGGVAWAFQTGHAGNWHPLTWLSHMLDAQLFGKGPAGPHLVNLLFHAANSALLFLLLHSLTASRWRSALVAALFALHPLHVESVAWVAERKDVLSAFFGLLSLWMYGLYVGQSKVLGLKSKVEAAQASAPQDSGLTPQAKRFYLLSLVFFALGLMSKPMLVTWPFVLLLLDYWPLRRFAFSPRSEVLPPRSARQLFVEKIPFLLLTLASCVATFIAQKAGGAVQPLASLSIITRIENALVSYVRYLGKTFYPVNLAAPYPYPSHWPVMQVVLAAVVLAVLCLAALWFGRRYPFVLVGWFWFLGTLIPVIGLMQVGEQSMADRYTYIPLIGVFVILAWGTVEVFKTLSMRSLGSAFAAGLVLVPCAVLTRNQLRYWHDTEALFRHATLVTKNNWLAFSNLGSYFDTLGRTDEALANYRRAVELQPNFGDALNNIGCLLAGKKQYAEAIAYFEAALRATPDLLEAHNNLGRALKDSGKIDDAILQFQLVLRRKPNHVEALNNLASALVSKGQFVEAIPYFQTSLQINPGQAVIHYNFANALARLKRADEAAAQYRLALQLKPDYAEARHDLGISLAMRGKLEEAIPELRQAVRSRPEDPAMHFSLGKALAGRQQFDEAIVEFEESLRYGPNNPLVHFSLGKALATQKKFSEAAGHFTEALRLKPDFAPAKQALQALDSPL